MNGDLAIRDVRFVASPAQAHDIDAEHAVPPNPRLVGYASAIFGELLVLDGFGVHAWVDGRYSISFPTRKSPSGKVHRIVRATSNRARFEVERRLLLALEHQGVLR